MPSQMKTTTAVMGLVVALAASACAGQAARDLAVESGDAAVVIGIELNKFARRHKAVVDRRVAAIGELAAVVRLGRGQFARDLDLVKRYEVGDAIDRLNTVITLSDQYTAQDKTTKEEAEAALSAADEGQQMIETDAKAWQALGRDLLKLSKEGDGAFDRVKFIFGFVQDVAANVKKAEEDGQEGAGNAAAAADTVAAEGATETEMGTKAAEPK